MARIILLLSLLLLCSSPVNAKEQATGKLPSYSLLEATVNTKSRFNGHYLVKKENLSQKELDDLARHFMKKYKKYQIVVLRLWDDSKAYKEYKAMMDPQKSDVGGENYWERYDRVTGHLLVSYEKNRNTGVENLIVLGEEKVLSAH